MATTATKHSDSGLSAIRWDWSLSNNDSGDAVDMHQYPDRCVTIKVNSGTPTVTLQGSNDGLSWAILTDYDGNNISFTSGTNIVGVRENTWYCRGVLGGTGTADVQLVGNGVRQ